VGAKLGVQKCPRRRVFLSAIQDDFSATSQRPIVAKFGHYTWIAVETQILDRNLLKVSTQGSFSPKNLNLEGVKHAPHSEQATGQGVHCREIPFTPRYSKGQKVSEVGQLFVQRTVAELRGVKLPNFRILAYFPHTKRLKSTFRWPAYSPEVTSQNLSDFCMW